MANYYHLYTNNPTAGAQDGTIVSENRLMTSPISVVLDATQAESKVIKCAIRCEDGFESFGDTILQPYYYDGSAYVVSGGNVDKWKIAPDLSTAGLVTIGITSNAGSGDAITIGDVVLTAGTDFDIGTSINDTSANIANAITAKSNLYNATADNSVITVKELFAGGGNTPALIKVVNGTTSSNKLVATQNYQTQSTAATAEQMNVQGKWDNKLTITDKVTKVNHIFWLKAISTADELPQKDDTISVHAKIVVQAV